MKWLRSGRSAPRSGLWSEGSLSHFGPPTEPKRIASDCSQVLRVSSGSGDPVRSMAAPPTGFSVKLKETP